MTLPLEVYLNIKQYLDPFARAVLGLDMKDKSIKETIFRQGGPSILLETILERGGDIRAMLTIKDLVNSEVAINKAVATMDKKLVIRVFTIWGSHFSNSGSMLAEKLKFTWALENIKCNLSFNDYQWNRYYVSTGEFKKLNLDIYNPLRTIDKNDVQYLNSDLLNIYTRHMNDIQRMVLYFKLKRTDLLELILNYKIHTDHSNDFLDQLFKECPHEVRQGIYKLFSNNLDSWCKIHFNNRLFMEIDNEYSKLTIHCNENTPLYFTTIMKAVDNKDIETLKTYPAMKIAPFIYESIYKDELFQALNLDKNVLYRYWPDEFEYDLNTLTPDSKMVYSLLKREDKDLNIKLIEHGLITVRRFMGQYYGTSADIYRAILKKYGKKASHMYYCMATFRGPREDVIWLLNRCTNRDYKLVPERNWIPNLYSDRITYYEPYCDISVKTFTKSLHLRNVPDLETLKKNILVPLDASTALFEYYGGKERFEVLKAEAEYKRLNRDAIIAEFLSTDTNFYQEFQNELMEMSNEQAEIEDDIEEEGDLFDENNEDEDNDYGNDSDGDNNDGDGDDDNDNDHNNNDYGIDDDNYENYMKQVLNIFRNKSSQIENPKYFLDMIFDLLE